MLFVENEPNKDPRVNLAIEEYLIRNVAPRDEILMFYINQPSIIIGRNQITVQEINVDYVEAHDIIVVRRLSGGGAVYHDLGNLNFSFIAPNSPMMSFSAMSYAPSLNSFHAVSLSAPSFDAVLSDFCHAVGNVASALLSTLPSRYHAPTTLCARRNFSCAA